MNVEEKLARIRKFRAKTAGKVKLTESEISTAKKLGKISIVADTNLIVYLLIESDFTAIAEKIYRQDSDWIALSPLAIGVP